MSLNFTNRCSMRRQVLQTRKVTLSDLDFELPSFNSLKFLSMHCLVLFYETSQMDEASHVYAVYGANVL